MDDSGIIELFFNRSEQAIEELSQKYGRLLQKLAGNILGNRRDVEECINDTYFGIWNQIPPKRPDNLSAYACRIARNQALKRYEANTAFKRNSQYEIAFEELEDCLAAGSDPAAECEGRELTRLIEAFLDTLKKEDRILFVRRYWFADSVLELSERMGLTPDNTSVRLSRIRSRLRIYLERSGY
ncbi:MAG: sigma-70 family RNA polymerase sigma factor [Lachnospiraceae bacterium]|nr:sigma-70 family RNA polymerase sigma factor [Lachnospiraceae bacterium]